MAFISPFHFRFNSVFYQTKISRKMPEILKILRNPGSKIRVGFCRFPWGSNNFIEDIPCHIQHYSMELDNQARYSKASKIIVFCQN